MTTAHNGERWERRKIQDLSEYVTVGFVGSMSSLFVDEGVPVLRGQNVHPYSLDLANLKYISRETHFKWRKSALRPGDVVVVRVGYPGTACVVPEGIGELNAASLVIVRPDSLHLDPFYLAYVLNSAWGKAQIAGRLVGAAQQVFNTQTAAELEIPAPPLPIQRRIAGILSAYDDLIENSQRRIKILEEMARRLYREWFVHFRFPGHEDCRFVDSPLGEIPEGWRICELSELVQFKSGFAFKSGTFTAGGKHRLITIKNVQDGAFNPDTDTYIGDLPEKLPPYCLLANNDVLVSLTGNVGRVCLVYDGPFLLNQRVAKLAPVEAFDWALVYSMFRQAEMRVKLELLSNGVAQQNLSPVLASKMEIIKPPRELRHNFSRLAEPIMLNIVQLYTSIQNLRRTRDLLLPRLLSGQIDVEALPEPTAEAHASSSN